MKKETLSSLIVTAWVTMVVVAFFVGTQVSFAAGVAAGSVVTLLCCGAVVKLQVESLVDDTMDTADDIQSLEKQ